MTHEQVHVSVDGAVGTVMLNRPDALNALTPTMLDELNVAYDELAKDAAVDALVASICETSMGSLAAYKDLYRAAESSGIAAGLDYEYSHDYTDYTDATDERLAGFR